MGGWEGGLGGGGVEAWCVERLAVVAARRGHAEEVRLVGEEAEEARRSVRLGRLGALGY